MDKAFDDYADAIRLNKKPTAAVSKIEDVITSQAFTARMCALRRLESKSAETAEKDLIAKSTVETLLEDRSQQLVSVQTAADIELLKLQDERNRYETSGDMARLPALNRAIADLKDNLTSEQDRSKTVFTSRIAARALVETKAAKAAAKTAERKRVLTTRAAASSKRSRRVSAAGDARSATTDSDDATEVVRGDSGAATVESSHASSPAVQAAADEH